MKDLLPQQIGRYKVRSLLGQGSMGVVYLAHDPQLDRAVAIKTIHLPTMLTAIRRARLTQSLLKEARLAARLNHPGIVGIYDAGEQDSEPFLVMERIEGAPLSDALARQGAFDPEFAMRLMQELLAAIAYAHDQGIIHRDLKPANIMLQPNGHLHVMDFGIAQAIAEQSPGGEALAGTPRYMSPEQIECRPLDPRSDIFSLGTIFYELLTGRNPFPQHDFDSLREAIVKTSYAPLATVRPNLPAGLHALIERAMQRSPGNRFRSAREMLEELHRCQQSDTEAEAQETTQANQNNREIVDFILQRISRQGDFPATLQFIADVTQTARKTTASASVIAESILKDFALTNRVLRLVNSPVYRTSGLPISTISRAVVLLGTDLILDLAAGLSIFEHFQNRSNILDLKALTIHALLTALQAREVAREVNYENTEEAFICGMLHHLGRLIVAFYFPEEHQAVTRLVQQGALDEECASHKIMRISYANLGEAVSQSWQLPEKVYRGIIGLSPSHKGSLRTPEQRLQGIVSFAANLSRVTMIPDDARRRLALVNLSQQFEGLIDVRPRRLEQIVETALNSALDLSQSLRVSLARLGLAEEDSPEPAETINQPPEFSNAPDSGSLDGSAPRPDYVEPTNHPGLVGPNDPDTLHRQAFLMQTIGELTAALAGSFQINDVLMMVLEGMYRGIGFEHVMIALISADRAHVRCRFALGPNADEIRRVFHFSLKPPESLPARCMDEVKEFYIASLDQGNWRSAFSPDLYDLLQARSVVLLPIVLRGQAIGLFMVDRSADQPPISKTDLLNLRTLAGQAVLALKQAQSKP